MRSNLSVVELSLTAPVRMPANRKLAAPSVVTIRAHRLTAPCAGVTMDPPAPLAGIVHDLNRA